MGIFQQTSLKWSWVVNFFGSSSSLDPVRPQVSIEFESCRCTVLGAYDQLASWAKTQHRHRAVYIDGSFPQYGSASQNRQNGIVTLLKYPWVAYIQVACSKCYIGKTTTSIYSIAMCYSYYMLVALLPNISTQETEGFLPTECEFPTSKSHELDKQPKGLDNQHHVVSKRKSYRFFCRFVSAPFKQGHCFFQIGNGDFSGPRKGPSNLKNLEYWAKVDEDICIASWCADSGQQLGRSWWLGVTLKTQVFVGYSHSLVLFLVEVSLFWLRWWGVMIFVSQLILLPRTLGAKLEPQGESLEYFHTWILETV